ncbi:MAG: restriction endonuclease subunit S [Gordonibacter sp.]|nr:restriction endonuclease subunit S [Gordonibacter sp.]
MKTELKDVCESIVDGDHQPPPKASSGIPFITISNFDQCLNTIDFTSVSHVPVEYYETLSDSRRARSGDILYSAVGSFGIPVLVKNDMPFVFQRHIAILRPNPKKIDSRFLFYSMKNPEFYRWADAVAIGAAQRTVTLTLLRKKEINLPPLSEQERIVGILSTYDRLIENNCKQIKLLEEAAQRLYKEWFIDLKFPGHETTLIDPTTNLPEGWRKGTLADIVEFKRGKIITAAKAKEGSVPVVAGGLGPAYFHSQGNTTAPVVTVSGSGANAGFTRLYMQDIWASDCSYVDSTMVDCLYYVYESVVNIGHGFQHLQRGSAQPHVYPSHINSTTLVLPPDEIRQLFCQVVAPPFEQCAVAERVVLNAQEARDRLLPKLMSGEIEV